MPTITAVTENNAPTPALSLDDLLPAFHALTATYARSWGRLPVLVNAQGEAVAGMEDAEDDCTFAPRQAAFRRRLIEESVRWGEPSIELCPHGAMVWAVPLMTNAQIRGGLFVTAGADTAGQSPLPLSEVRRATLELLTLAEQANLTNAAFLEMRRLAARRESDRAEAIHALKEQNYHSIRDIYLVEEPGLLSAIKGGNRAAAREILNRMLVGIYFMGRNRPSLLKSFLLELVVIMSRSAVEAGGDPTELLGANYSAFAELAHIDGEEALCEWLVALLERIMDAINAGHSYPIGMLLGAAMQYMHDHLHEELSRDDIARIACLSPSHFSRVVKQTFGDSFTDLLARMRVERAREMLVLTEKSLIQIGMDCGFHDQSYFTKVFQKYTGRPPGEYRRLHRSTL